MGRARTSAGLGLSMTSARKYTFCVKWNSAAAVMTPCRLAGGVRWVGGRARSFNKIVRNHSAVYQLLFRLLSFVDVYISTLSHWHHCRPSSLELMLHDVTDNHNP